jgi:hypothetical protein
MTTTENGAVTFASSLDPVLDYFALGSSLRSRTEQDIESLFAKAYASNKEMALKCLFYSRDVRGGQGERRSFRVILKYLKKHSPKDLIHVLSSVPEYGRWDDLWVLLEQNQDPVSCLVKAMVSCQLIRDFNALGDKKSPSLLGKWMPSNNTSSKNTRRLAAILQRHLGCSSKDYRKMLSILRGEVVEHKMCANDWKSILYRSVPSKAHMNYRKAFAKHDPFGYAEYTSRLNSGEEKINSKTLYPYELYDAIVNSEFSPILEAQWRSLPNYIQDSSKNILVLADVSASMNGRPMSVSVSLALYVAERSRGDFANMFLTFESSPSLVKIEGATVREKMLSIRSAPWGGSTDLLACFDLILRTAIDNDVPQSDMPNVLLVISDMEFNRAHSGSTNFSEIKRKYNDAGYELPTIAFWNVDARNDQVPVTKDEYGTLLASGCSPSIMKNILNNAASSPVQMMLDVLNSDRYSSISLSE